MERRAILWLYSELPSLVEDGVLSSESADRLRRHYGDVSSRTRQAVFIAIAALGTSLIGAGIILLLAHNWDALSRISRTVLAFLPLVVGQGLVAWTLIRRPRSAALREGSATLVACAVGSCIALIGQTYQIPGNLESFLFACCLLILPLPYLVGSSTVAALYMVAATAWAGAAQESGGHALWYWPLMLLMLPHVFAAIKTDRHGLRAVDLLWVTALCLTFGTGIALEKSLPGLWTIVYPGMFAAMVLAGRRWLSAPALWRRPLQAVGTCGTVVLALMLTYDWPWNRVGWAYYRDGQSFIHWASWADYLLAGILPIATVVLWIRSQDRSRPSNVLLALTPLIATLAFVSCALIGQSQVAQLLFNLLLFGMGVTTLMHGFSSQSLGSVNGGLVMVSILVVARFFDSDIGFIARGLLFIAVGIGFLLVNLWLVRARNSGDRPEVTS